MNFKISKDIFQKFPELNIGIVVVRGIDNSGESEIIMNLIRNKEKHIRDNFSTETLSQNPKIES